MAPSPASDTEAAGSEEKGPTSPAGGGNPRAIVLVLMAVVVVAVPILLMSRFHGHPMSQVLIISVSICSYVFFFLVCIWRGQWFFSYCVRLSYGPLLAFFSAAVIGSARTTFVLLFSTIWAAANLGYSLAAHRLLKDDEPAIHAIPSPSFNAKDSVKELNFNIYIGAPIAVLVWTLFMAMVIYLAKLTDELDITFILSYFGWIHVAVWVFFATQLPVQGVLFREQIQQLLPLLVVIGMPISPAIILLSQVLSVLCHLLLMLALVAFLWYNIAIYIYFLELETDAPSTTTWGSEDTLQSEIQGDNIGQVKSDPTLWRNAK